MVRAGVCTTCAPLSWGKVVRTIDGIGGRLKGVREALGLTQTGIAEAVGGKLRSWQDYEAGRKAPGSQVIAGLVRLGVNANWVLTGEGPVLLSDLQAQAAPQVPHVPLVLDGKALAIALEAVEGVVRLMPAKTWSFEEKADLFAAIYKVAMDTGGDTYAMAKVFNDVAKAFGRGVA